MVLRLIDNAMFFTVRGIDIVGNPRNGAIIGLDREGRAFCEAVRALGAGDPAGYAESERTLLEAMANLGFFDGAAVSGLRSAYVHLTDRCNLHCTGCYSFVDHRNARPDLTTPEALRVIDQVVGQGATEIVFSGGEPLLRADIAQVVRHAKERGCTVCLITNGTVRPQGLDDLLPHLDTLSVSIDGYSDDTEFIRDRGVMPKVLDFVRSMTSKVHVHLIVTLHHRNVEHMLRYAQLADDLGVTFNFSVFSVDPRDPAVQGLQLDSADLVRIARTIEASDRAYLDESVLAGGDGLDGLMCKSGCGVGRELVSIAADGTVYPCHMMHNPDQAMGNVLAEDLSAILARPCPAAEVTLDDVEECRGCEFRHLCGAGCRGRSLLQFQNLERRDPFCLMTKTFLQSRTRSLLAVAEKI